MNDPRPIFVIETNDFAAKVIRGVIARYDLARRVEVVKDVPEAENSSVIMPSHPIRVGALLDRIFGVLYPRDSDETIDLGGGRYIDVRLSVYYASVDADPVRLTEKEIALLVILAEKRGGAVSRDQLLDDVWQYVEGVETHTLETHIYRLRQKIETDPSNPHILKTNDDGYFLSVE